MDETMDIYRFTYTFFTFIPSMYTWIVKKVGKILGSSIHPSILTFENSLLFRSVVINECFFLQLIFRTFW